MFGFRVSGFFDLEGFKVVKALRSGVLGFCRAVGL